MTDYGRRLADAIDEALPAWVERCVARRLGDPSDEALAMARAAGERARTDAGAAIRELLLRDIDDQQINPLALLRAAVTYPTEVLAAAGVAAVERDRFSKERFPDDVYDLTPATWSDIDPALTDFGIAWGAAKALEHKRRHSS